MKFDFRFITAVTGSLLFCLLQIQTLSAQQEDTTRDFSSADIKFTTLDRAYQLQPIDTGLTGYQYYNPLNAAIEIQKEAEISDEFAYLGYLGSAYQVLSLPSNPELEFQLDYHSFEAYLRQPRDLHFYRTPTPFTRANYMLGLQNQQKFNITHTQNVNERVNVGVNYDRIRSEGFYIDQLADHQSISLFSWIQSKNQKYNLMVGGIWNKSTVLENGGITNIEALEEVGALTSRLGVDVQDSILRELDNKIGQLHHSWDWGYYQQHPINDTATYRTFHPTHRLTHNFQYSNFYTVYENKSEDSSIYQNHFISKDSTYDSLRYTKITNKVAFQLLKRKKKKDTGFVARNHTLSAGIRHSLYNITYRGEQWKYTSQQLHNLTALFEGKRYATPSTRWIYEVKGRYSLIDYNAGDYYGLAGVKYRGGEQKDTIKNKVNYAWESGIKVFQNHFAPSWKSMRYYGNHYQWDNDFQKMTLSGIRLFLEIPDWHLGLTVNGYLVRQLVYYSEEVEPHQYKGSFPMASAQLTKNFHWGQWHFDNRITLHYVTADSILHLPQFRSKHSFYFESRWFGNTMKTHVGVDIYFRSPYKINAYSPALSEFYLQNERRYPHPPVTDLFLNFRVKKARVFAKASFFDQFFLQEANYLEVYPYPMPPFNVKVGFTWDFHN